jgi:hypothetical protein
VCRRHQRGSLVGTAESSCIEICYRLSVAFWALAAGTGTNQPSTYQQESLGAYLY